MSVSKVDKSVRAWLASARDTADHAGDVMRDMRGDETLPHSFRSIEEMRSYLKSHSACTAAVAAVPVVWRRYASWLARRRLRGGG